MAFYDQSVKELDAILDRLSFTAALLAQTGGKDADRAVRLRSAATIVQGCRDEMLAHDHDKTRKDRHGAPPGSA